MRKLKRVSNFVENKNVPDFLNNDKLLFFGYYKTYTCIATIEDNKTTVSFPDGARSINFSTDELVEIVKKFNFYKVNSWEVKSPYGDFKTRYFQSADDIVN